MESCTVQQQRVCPLGLLLAVLFACSKPALSSERDPIVLDGDRYWCFVELAETAAIDDIDGDGIGDFVIVNPFGNHERGLVALWSTGRRKPIVEIDRVGEGRHLGLGLWPLRGLQKRGYACATSDLRGDVQLVRIDGTLVPVPRNQRLSESPCRAVCSLPGANGGRDGIRVVEVASDELYVRDFALDPRDDRGLEPMEPAPEPLALGEHLTLGEIALATLPGSGPNIAGILLVAAQGEEPTSGGSTDGFVLCAVTNDARSMLWKTVLQPCSATEHISVAAEEVNGGAPRVRVTVGATICWFSARDGSPETPPFDVEELRDAPSNPRASGVLASQGADVFLLCENNVRSDRRFPFSQWGRVRVVDATNERLLWDTGYDGYLRSVVVSPVPPGSRPILVVFQGSSMSGKGIQLFIGPCE